MGNCRRKLKGEVQPKIEVTICFMFFILLGTCEITLISVCHTAGFFLNICAHVV